MTNIERDKYDSCTVDYISSLNLLHSQIRHKGIKEFEDIINHLSFLIISVQNKTSKLHKLKCEIKKISLIVWQELNSLYFKGMIKECIVTKHLETISKLCHISKIRSWYDLQQSIEIAVNTFTSDYKNTPCIQTEIGQTKPYIAREYSKNEYTVISIINSFSQLNQRKTAEGARMQILSIASLFLFFSKDEEGHRQDIFKYLDKLYTEIAKEKDVERLHSLMFNSLYNVTFIVESLFLKTKENPNKDSLTKEYHNTISGLKIKKLKTARFLRFYPVETIKAKNIYRNKYDVVGYDYGGIHVWEGIYIEDIINKEAMFVKNTGEVFDLEFSDIKNMERQIKKLYQPYYI